MLRLKREPSLDRKFENCLRMEHLIGKEKPAWEAFENVHNFLGNQRAENYNVAVNELLRTYQELGCNMLLKILFLDSQLDFLAFVAL